MTTPRPLNPNKSVFNNWSTWLHSTASFGRQTRDFALAVVDKRGEAAVRADHAARGHLHARRSELRRRAYDVHARCVAAWRRLFDQQMAKQSLVVLLCATVLSTGREHAYTTHLRRRHVNRWYAARMDAFVLLESLFVAPPIVYQRQLKLTFAQK